MDRTVINCSTQPRRINRTRSKPKPQKSRNRTNRTQCGQRPDTFFAALTAHQANAFGIVHWAHLGRPFFRSAVEVHVLGRRDGTCYSLHSEGGHLCRVTRICSAFWWGPSGVVMRRVSLETNQLDIRPLFNNLVMFSSPFLFLFKSS